MINMKRVKKTHLFAVKLTDVEYHHFKMMITVMDFEFAECIDKNLVKVVREREPHQ